MKAIIIGAGDVGTHLAQHFGSLGFEVGLVDVDHSALLDVEEKLDVMTVKGNATHRQLLEAVKVKDADVVAAVTSNDETNLVSAALAASMGAQRAVARIDDPGFYKTGVAVEADVLGVHAALCASRLVSDQLLINLLSLDANFSMSVPGAGLVLAAVPLTADSPALGESALDLHVGDGVRIAAVQRDHVLRPPQDIARLEVGDAPFLTGRVAHVLLATRRLVTKKHARRVAIIGGGDVGLQLARALAPVERRVQLIELDRPRCEQLSLELQNVDIVHGDGTNISVLRDEQLEGADYLLTATRSDEVNLMASLLAIDLGVPDCFALLHRAGYADAYRRLGIRGTAGAHTVIARTVTRMLPKMASKLAEPIPKAAQSVVEFKLGRIDHPVAVRDVKLPDSCHLLLAARGNVNLALNKNPQLRGSERLIVAAPTRSNRRGRA